MKRLARIEFVVVLVLTLAVSLSIAHGVAKTLIPAPSGAPGGLGAQLEVPLTAEFAPVEEPPVALAPAFTWPGMPPVYNQGQTGECVAFSVGTLQTFHDHIDQGPGFFNPNQPLFFARIGGTEADGAYMSIAMAQLLNVGYPAKSTPDNSGAHRIASYRRVALNVTAIKTALVKYGVLAVISPYYHSWFTPVNGVLPQPDYVIGGHAFDIFGYDDTKAGGSVGAGPGAFLWRNSWGPNWGDHGNAWLPYQYATIPYAVYASVDVNDAPAPSPTPVPTPSPTLPPTAPPTQAPTSSPSLAPSPATPTPSAVPTLLSPTPTATPGPSVVPTLGPSPSASPIPVPPAPGSANAFVFVVLVLTGIAAGVALWKAKR